MTGDQRHDEVGAAIAAAAATVHAPAALRARVRGQASRRRSSGVPRLALGGAVAAALAALVLVVTGGGPTVQDVAVAALRAPTLPAAAGTHVGTVRFRDYGSQYGWRAVGRREDRVDGRRAVTVVYRNGGRGVHYAVLGGAPVRLPDGRRVTVQGRRYVVLRNAGATLVAWHQGGHTCVLASKAVGERELVRFASWG